MGHTTLFEHESHTRVEAVFPDADSAQAAASGLSKRCGLELARINQLTPGEATLITQRNKLDHRASGRVLQRRQLKYTAIAFSLLLVGMLALHLLKEGGVLTYSQVTLGLAVLIGGAALLTVHGLLSWRHGRVLAGARPKGEGEVLLQIDVHDVSEQYEICQALDEMGVEARTTAIAGDT